MQVLPGHLVSGRSCPTDTTPGDGPGCVTGCTGRVDRSTQLQLSLAGLSLSKHLHGVKARWEELPTAVECQETWHSAQTRPPSPENVVARRLTPPGSQGQGCPLHLPPQRETPVWQSSVGSG